MKSPLTKFILTALGIFIAWYIVYEKWLLPDGRLDEWLSVNIVGVSTGILKLFGLEVFHYGRVTGLAGQPGVEIVDGCNGISAIGLFLGFVIAFPGPWQRKVSFCITGIGIIYLVNIIRVVFLVITQAKWPAVFSFTHDYSTTGIFYAVIFLLWMVWANYNDFLKKELPLPDTAAE